MKSFAKNVYTAMRSLQTEHHFVPSPMSESSKFAALVRYHTDDVYIYVLVQDARSGGSNLTVSLWIAPPEEPGGSLDSLNVGYKLTIGSQYNVDDSFFASSCEKIATFLQVTPTLAPLVAEELSNPFFPSYRWTVYQQENAAFERAYEAAANGVPAALNAFAIADGVARRTERGHAFEASCEHLATTILELELLESPAKDFFSSKPHLLRLALVNRLYISALGRASKALQGAS